RSNSNRAGCKQYAKKSYFRFPMLCSDNPLIIKGEELDEDSEVQIRVVQQPTLNIVGIQSTIRIQRIGEHEFADAKQSCLTLGRTMKACNGKYSVRDPPIKKQQCWDNKLPHGFDGHMFAIGQHIDSYGLKEHPINYASTNEKIQLQTTEFNDLLLKIFKRRCYWEYMTLQKGLACNDELPPHYFGGRSAATKSFNMSHNLANAAHFDPNDLGTGFAVWVFDDLDDPNSIEQYFVLPNLLTRDANGVTHKGILIKLCDRHIITWNGNVIRHCTSIRNMPNLESSFKEGLPGDVYSFHYANSMPNLKAYKEVRLKEYIKEMNITLMPIIRNEDQELQVDLPSTIAVNNNSSFINNHELSEYDWTMEEEAERQELITKYSNQTYKIPISYSANAKKMENDIKRQTLQLVQPNWEAYWHKIKYHTDIYKHP
ncbi:MAG TPA: hypothetical protein VIQ31_05785, partial [Phormidium sp.]